MFDFKKIKMPTNKKKNPDLPLCSCFQYFPEPLSWWSMFPWEQVPGMTSPRTTSVKSHVVQSSQILIIWNCYNSPLLLKMFFLLKIPYSQLVPSWVSSLKTSALGRHSGSTVQRDQGNAEWLSHCVSIIKEHLIRHKSQKLKEGWEVTLNFFQLLISPNMTIEKAKQLYHPSKLHYFILISSLLWL